MSENTFIDSVVIVLPNPNALTTTIVLARGGVVFVDGSMQAPAAGTASNAAYTTAYEGGVVRYAIEADPTSSYGVIVKVPMFGVEISFTQHPWY